MRKDTTPAKKYESRSGERHWAWKGNDVGYNALHDWIVSIYGKANHCERCGADKIPKGKKYWFEWSRKTKKTSRNRKDWRQLCIPCHREVDDWKNKIKL